MIRKSRDFITVESCTCIHLYISRLYADSVQNPNFCSMCLLLCVYSKHCDRHCGLVPGMLALNLYLALILSPAVILPYCEDNSGWTSMYPT